MDARKGRVGGEQMMDIEERWPCLAWGEINSFKKELGHYSTSLLPTLWGASMGLGRDVEFLLQGDFRVLSDALTSILQKTFRFTEAIRPTTGHIRQACLFMPLRSGWEWGKEHLNSVSQNMLIFY